ncbi:MAG: efflux RND transporter periplasmic adaptor subunit, partial [Armatimonadia bacterium]|nr:efflux RND transporter periplasmic adaptor subunit [Armatimonadia bacterium]
ARDAAVAARDGAEADVSRARASLEAAGAKASQARAAMAGAEADAERAEARIEGERAKVSQAEADLRSADADLAYWGAEYRRDQALLAEGAISESEADATRRSFEVAKSAQQAAAAKLDAARATLRESEAALAGARQAYEAAQEALRASEAAAQVAQADLEKAQAALASAGAKARAAEAEAIGAETDVAQEQSLLAGEISAVEGAESRLEQARYQLEQAEAREREAASVVEADRNMVLQAQAQAREAAAAATGAYESYVAQRTVSDYTTIRALTSGVVSKREADPGTLVGPGKAILAIGAFDAVRVQAKVASEHADLLSPGDTAYVRLSEDPADVVTSTVTTVFPAADMQTRTGTVELTLDNRGLDLKQHEFVKVDLVLQRHEDVLVVPSEAVQNLDGQDVVFVHEEGSARRVDVTTGVDNGVMTEIIVGLDPGDAVILKNASKVSDGVAVSTEKAPFMGTGDGAEGTGGGHTGH